MSEKNKQNFSELVSNTDWSNIINSEDTQAAFTDFHTTLKSHFEKSFPITKVNFKYNNRKPWLSEDLRNSIKHKNKLHIKSVNIPTVANETAYKDYKKHLSKELLAAEKQHIQHLLDTHKNNLGKSWKIIKAVINKDSLTKTQQSFMHGESLVTNKEEIAEHFNDFCVNIGPSLSKKNT